MRKSFSKRIVITTAIVIGVVVALTVGYAVFRHKTLYHLSTVVPEKVYRSGTLSEYGLRWSEDLTNIKTIVNLRSEMENDQPWYDRQRRLADELGVEMIDIPMDAGVPPTNEQIDSFLAIATDSKRLPILVHCEQGVIRTGMMVAAYQVDVMGRENQRVFEEMPMFGHDWNGADKIPVKNFILNHGKIIDSGGGEE